MKIYEALEACSGLICLPLLQSEDLEIELFSITGIIIITIMITITTIIIIFIL